MKVVDREPEGPVRLLEPTRHRDERGWFSETYSEAAFARLGIECRFVQDNHSASTSAYTLRGLHFQRPPYAQDKLVRCTRGRVFDVVVDLRSGSPTYGRWIGAELSEDNGRQVFAPAGFAHGFVTLEPGSEVCYKVSAPYAPDCDGGVRWDDPALAIRWPLPPGLRPILSPKDERLPLLNQFTSPFAYTGGPLGSGA